MGTGLGARSPRRTRTWPPWPPGPACSPPATRPRILAPPHGGRRPCRPGWGACPGGIGQLARDSRPALPPTHRLERMRLDLFQVPPQPPRGGPGLRRDLLVVDSGRPAVLDHHLTIDHD